MRALSVVDPDDYAHPDSEARETERAEQRWAEADPRVAFAAHSPACRCHDCQLDEYAP